MNVNYMFSLIAVIVLGLLAYVGGEVADWSRVFFGIIIPLLAVIVFIIGVIYRVLYWARSPVPFRIPTTAGQQKTLPWIKYSYIDNPSNTLGVIARMFLEVVTFRSLFRNTKSAVNNGTRISYKLEIWLWVAALAFHYSFLVVITRHFRFFLEPVPFLLQALETLDTFIKVEFVADFLGIGLPAVFLSGPVLLAAVIYLFLRRVYIPQVKYISLAQDFFPLFLIIGIALTGILMRYFTKVDIVAIKGLAMGLVTFRPQIPDGVGGLFYAHLFLVSILLAYFPFSKLMHMGGIFMSPTRNLANNNRAKRHINPWNYPVKVHTYDEYEEEFREKMIEAGLPVEKE